MRKTAPEPPNARGKRRAMPHPPVRFVEAIPIREDGQVLVLLRDPEDLAPGEMLITRGAYVLVTLLDGTRDTPELQAAILERSGEIVPAESIETFIQQLDEAYLLENHRTQERREEVLREYREQSNRPAAHAGAAYPAEPEKLQRSMEMLFSSLDDPSKASPLPENELSGHGPNRKPGGTPRGLIVPHIDIRCGGPCMARGFQALRAEGPPPPRRYVILGVAHHATPHLYTMTEKDFATPLGNVPVDLRLTAKLKEVYGEHLLEGELAHKREHSVEFAALFLKYLHGETSDCSIVPILCGSLHEEMNGTGTGRSPHERGDVRAFCTALRTLLSEPGDPICIIASVDLSHVGLKFGDANGVDPVRAQRIRNADMAMLEKVSERDPEGFFDHFRSDANARNVDAVSAVYTLLHTLSEGPTELIDYDQYLEQSTESVVSFASMALY